MASPIRSMTRASSLVQTGFNRHVVQSTNLPTHNLRISVSSQSTRNYILCTQLRRSSQHSHKFDQSRLQPYSYRFSKLELSCKRRDFHQLWRRLSQPSRRDAEEKSNESPTSSTPNEASTTSRTKPTELLRRLSESAIPPITRHENIYTLPNILTFTRLLAAPAVGYFILTHQPLNAMLLFFYAGVTDAVDGYLARKYNQQTVVGTVIDPMADKALMTISVVALGVTGIFPWWLATIILGRDVALAISAIYFRWISLPPPKTMARYWDFSLPSAEVHPTEISKINTLLQLLLVGNGMLLPVLPVDLVSTYNLQGIFEGWQFLVAGTTIWSGLSYVFNKDAVKILSQEEVKEKEKEKAEKEAKEDQKL